MCIFLFKKCCDFPFPIEHTSSNNKRTSRVKQLRAVCFKKKLMYSWPNNIQIKINLHVSHLQIGHNSLDFTQISYIVRRGRKHPNVSILEFPHYLKMVKVRIEEAVYFDFLLLLFSPFFFITNSYRSFPCLLSCLSNFSFLL